MRPIHAPGAMELLRTADGMWVGGGETFVLLAELYRTGQLEVIRMRALAGVPYGGARRPPRLGGSSPWTRDGKRGQTRWLQGVHNSGS
jgi:hypothetical protein